MRTRFHTRLPDVGNRVVRLLSAVRARRWLGRPTLAQKSARTKPLDVGHQIEAVKTKIWTIVVASQFLRTHLGFQNASWLCQSQRKSPGFVHLLGEVSTVSRWLYAYKYVVFARSPRQHACRCDRGRFKFVSFCFCASRRGLPRTHASTQNQGHVDRPTFLARHL